MKTIDDLVSELSYLNSVFYLEAKLAETEESEAYARGRRDAYSEIENLAIKLRDFLESEEEEKH